MNTYKYHIIVLLQAYSFTMYGQTTNMGNVTIQSNTQMSIVNDFNNTSTATLMNDGELFVYANYNNNGLVSYVDESNNGLTRFNGSDFQHITGNQLSEFYNVSFDNTIVENAFGLGGDISIVNQANFVQGIVDNDNFGGSISFEKMANHSNTSNDSHVDGSVYKNGDTDFVFPIGDGGFYRRAKIAAPDIVSDIISSKYLFQNSDGSYPHELTIGVIEFIDDAEYWIVGQEQGNSNVILTLSWDENTTPPEIISGNTSSIHIVRWDENLGYWVDEGGIVDEASKTVTTVAEISQYGVFTLAKFKEELIPSGELVIFNSVTPNKDGANDFFFIDGISQFPDNTLTIFNRWGVKVYETISYNESDNVFRGVSDGRATYNKEENLPAGTYFYILTYQFDNGTKPKNIKKTGYLYINDDNN